MRYLLFCFLLASFTWLTGCDRADRPAEKVNRLADAYVEAYFETYPEQAIVSGAPDLHPGALSNPTMADLQEWYDTEDSLLAKLEQIDPASIDNTPTEITYGFLKNRLETGIDMRVCRMDIWRVSPTYNSWLNRFSLIAGLQPVSTKEQRGNTYERFSKIPRYIKTEIENLKIGIAEGYTAPRTSVKAVIEQMNSLLDSPVSSSPFVKIAPDTLPGFKQKLEKLVSDEIRPTVTTYRDFLRDEYLENAREEVGVSALPNGEKCYRASTRYYITKNIETQKIHELGLEQMDILMEQMSDIGSRSVGSDDPARILEIVKEDPQYRFDSRKELISYAEDAVERAEAALPEWFGFVPETPVVVKPYPPFQEKSAPLGQAIPPSEDGSQPGQYIINAYKPEEQSKAGFEALSFHEAHPGHLFQIYVSLANEEKHPVTSYFFISGFGEGWALYSERLAEEMDLYTSDISRIGWLASEAHRAARLVVDSGMHALGWTRQESIDYLADHTTLTRNQATAETDRYIMVPGQATSYMVGSLEIRELRNMAEEKLGDSFDIKEFHDIVLSDGTIPLQMLRNNVKEWIAGNQ